MVMREAYYTRVAADRVVTRAAVEAGVAGRPMLAAASGRILAVLGAAANQGRGVGRLPDATRCAGLPEFGGSTTR